MAIKVNDVLDEEQLYYITQSSRLCQSILRSKKNGLSWQMATDPVNACNGAQCNTKAGQLVLVGAQEDWIAQLQSFSDKGGRSVTKGHDFIFFGRFCPGPQKLKL
jgi:hypothetical protein